MTDPHPPLPPTSSLAAAPEATPSAAPETALPSPPSSIPSLLPEDLTTPEAQLAEKMINRIKTVYDPEIPVNLYDLGLIYRLEINKSETGETFDAEIDMTLTAPGCPIADQMSIMVRDAVIDLPELNEVTVNLVWDPPWDKSRLTDEAKLALNLF